MYLLAPLLFLGIGFVLFSSTGRDDSHITYWAAQSLATFGEIVNYNGVRIEQSSSLLQVLLLALAHVVTGVSVVTLGSTLAILFGVATVVSTSVLAQQFRDDLATPVSFLTATAPYLVYWSFSGLESSMAAFCTVLLVAAYGHYLGRERRSMAALALTGLVTAAFVLVRPETIIVWGCTGVGVIVLITAIDRLASVRDSEEAKGQAAIDMRVRLLEVLAVGAIAAAVIFAIRINYFGQLLPQPVTAKSGNLTINHLISGYSYLKSFAILHPPFPGMAIVTVVAVLGWGVALWRQTRSRINPYVVIALVLVPTYVSFIIFSGGDWMELGRFLVPILPIIIILVVYAISDIPSNKYYIIIYSSILLIINIAILINSYNRSSRGMAMWTQSLQVRDLVPQDTEIPDFSWFETRNYAHARDMAPIAHLNVVVDELIDSGLDSVIMMSVQAGMVPYHLESNYRDKLFFIDMMDLTSNSLSLCPVLEDVDSGRNGLMVTYDIFFDRFNDLMTVCNIGNPDIIFDLLWTKQIMSVISNGYKIIYLQEGVSCGGGGWIKGPLHPMGFYIAVRNELVEDIQSFRPGHAVIECSAIKRPSGPGGSWYPDSTLGVGHMSYIRRATTRL